MPRRVAKPRPTLGGLWLVGGVVLCAALFYFWTAKEEAAPALVLGEVPENRVIVTLTGLPRDVDRKLLVDLPDGRTLTFAAEGGTHLVGGTARFTLPWQLAGQAVRLSLARREQPALQFSLRLTAADLTRQTLYLGSCLYEPDGPAASMMLGAILADTRGKPAPAMLWLGDNLYLHAGDWGSEAGMIRAYTEARRNPALAGLLQAMPHYAIWDDHDFGPNNADRTFPQRAVAQRVFHSHWANPPPATRDGGLYTSVRRGPVEIFLTDGRSYRDPPGGKTLFGQTQIDWLKAGLLRSSAPVKLIVGGSQWLTDHPNEEGWQHYPHERRAFLDWLVANKITGVLFISGDRHHSVLLQREHLGRPLFELTCSALSSRPDPVGVRGYERVRRLAQTARNNYCRLDLGTDATVTVTVLDETGTPRFTQILFLG